MLRVKKASLVVSIFLIISAILSCSGLALQQPASTHTYSGNLLSATHLNSAQADIFQSDEVLKFKLILNYKKLLKDRGDEREYHPAIVQYQSKEGRSIDVKLKVRIRGKHRRDPSVCRFPPLLLNFPKNDVAYTVFAGTNKLKLVTHCLNQDYVIREYLVYKLYNLITDQSYRVRLCEVLYEDAAGKKKTESSYAFLIEDTEQLAERIDGHLMSDKLVIRMDATEDRAMAKLALFQYMIGNTDWSVPYHHNIKLIYLEELVKPIPIPYDFDYTGIVMPPYAKPPPEIGITSVRERIFRGYDFPYEVYQELVPFFNNRKKAIYQVYTGNALLDRKYKKQTIKYLDEFYETINSPEKFEKQIVKAGQYNKAKNVVIKGLD